MNTSVLLCLGFGHVKACQLWLQQKICSKKSQGRNASQVKWVVDKAALLQDASKGESKQQAKQYKQLLDALNDVAHHEIDAWLSHEQHLSEPFVARSISEQLPSGKRPTVMSRLLD